MKPPLMQLPSMPPTPPRWMPLPSMPLLPLMLLLSMPSLTVDASAAVVAATVNAAPVDASAAGVVDAAVDAALVIEITKASEVSCRAQYFHTVFNMHCDIFYLFPFLCFDHPDQATGWDPKSEATTCCLGPVTIIYIFPCRPPLSNGTVTVTSKTLFAASGFYYFDYGLIFFSLWTYNFSMMACPTGIINP